MKTLKRIKREHITFLLWVVFLVSTISTIWYLSEPKYIDYIQKDVEKYDLVVNNTRYITELSIVLQVSKDKILIKDITGWNDSYHYLDRNPKTFDIVGKGTIYHKVNFYVGFNLMFISQILLSILLAVVIIINSKLLYDFLAIEK